MKPSQSRLRTAAAACALTLAPAGLIAPVPFAVAAPATTNPGDNPVLLMSVGASRVINLRGSMSDVIVTDPGVADVHVRSQDQLYILAKHRARPPSPSPPPAAKRCIRQRSAWART